MNIATLLVKIGADIGDLEKGLSKASRAIEDTGKRLTDMGKTLTTRVTAPLTALAGVAVRSFGIQEKAELQLRAALQANGRQVEQLFGQYNEFAQEMQRLTVVGDETTLAMLSQAEALGITGESAQRAVRNSIAMQSAFGVSAQSALRYTAALEEGNASMLGRYIPALRDISDESERVAKAQEILGNAFSVAEAEAQGTAGQFIQLKNAVGDLMEEIGEVIAEAVLPFVRRIKELAESLQGMNRVQKETAVALGGILALAGPVALGLGKITTAVTMLTRAMMKNPYLAIGAAVLALSTHVLIANRRLSRMNELVQEALNLPITGTRDEIDQINEAIVYQEELLARTIAQHETMGVIGSEASEKQLAPMRETLELLISQRDEAAKLQLDMMAMANASRAEIEEMNDSIRRTQQAYKEFIQATEVDYDIFDPAEHTRLRMIRQEFQEFDNALFDFMNSYGSLDFTERLSNDIENVSNKTSFLMNITTSFTNSFGQGMANVVVQGERLVDTLKNIGKLLASTVIQRGLQALLTGGLGTGDGFFGSGGGLLGRIFNVNDALITSGGDVVKFHKDDQILAMKDFSGLFSQNQGGYQRVEVFGTLRANDIFISSERGGTSFSR